MALRFHTSSIVAVLFCIVSSATPAKSSETRYDHYLGTYAYATTPYWPQFQVAQDGSDLILRLPGDEWTRPLEQLGEELVARDGDEQVFRLSYEPAVQRFGIVVSTIRSGAKAPIVMDKRTLVKLKPNPNDRLTAEYDVTTADLVKTVRAGENWIHQVRSLQIEAKYAWTKTPSGIVHRRREVKERWPDANLSHERLWGLTPHEKGELNVAFDKWRYRTYDLAHDKSECTRIWDGHEFIAHENYYTHNQEHYAFRKELPQFSSVLIDFMWPRAQYHRFWWNATQGGDENNLYGRAEEFILVGKQEYRGTPCYVLECFPKDLRRVRRWFVGVADGLLYGNLIYQRGQLYQERWTGQYREVASGCWFPMRQGYHVFQPDEAQEYFIASTRDISIENVAVNETLPRELFVMEFKDGVEVNDDRFGGFVTYKWKQDRTEAEWAEIRRRAQERQQRDDAEKQALDSHLGQAALEFPAECGWLHTEPVTVKGLRGKAVVLQFWGTWCGPCHNYMDLLNPPADGSQIIVIGVHTPTEDLDEIKADMAKYEATGPVCVDTGQTWGTIAQWYHVQRRPYWVVIGPDGKVVGHSERPAGAFEAARESLAATPQENGSAG